MTFQFKKNKRSLLLCVCLRTVSCVALLAVKLLRKRRRGMLGFSPQVNSFHNRLDLAWDCGQISEGAVNLGGNVARARPWAGASPSHQRGQNKHKRQEFPPRVRLSREHSDGVGVTAFTPLKKASVPSNSIHLQRKNEGN